MFNNKYYYMGHDMYKVSSNFDLWHHMCSLLATNKYNKKINRIFR